MATNYPTSLDTTAQLKIDATDTTATPTTHPAAHNNLSDAIRAIQAELGVLPKGNFATVVARLNGTIGRGPAAEQVLVPSGDFTPVTVQAAVGQTANVMEGRNSAGTALIKWSPTGVLDAVQIRQGGVLLNTSHLSDGAAVIKHPTPSITTPAISSPSFTGNPVAPTAAVDTSTTQVATTAFVVGQAYAKLASPAFTGTPTAPTPSTDDDSTKVATTAYAHAKLNAIKPSPIPAGSVMPHGVVVTTNDPTGWLPATGAAVSRTTYVRLFSAIGTRFGAGDGSTTFNLPGIPNGSQFAGTPMDNWMVRT